MPPARGCEVDHGTVVIMTAIERQIPWVLSQGKLEAQGCWFVYSSIPGRSWLVTPADIPIQLGRCPRGNTPQLSCMATLAHRRPSTYAALGKLGLSNLWPTPELPPT